MVNIHQLPAASMPSEQEAALTYKVATNAATLCGEIVKATATKIQNKKYVQVEGWLAIAAAHGCLVSIRDVETIEGGIRAIAELRRISDQALLATAEGFVGDDEKMWAGRPMYARRAMAQTRASSRVCRSAFAFVVVLIDKDLGTTPAEEMMGIIEHNSGGNPPQDWVDEAKKDGLIKGDPNKSQYQVDKLKKAVENEWRVTNTTPKGKLDQLYAYIDMARNPDDVALILKNNEQEIANSGEKDAIEKSADDLLRWFEKQSAPSLQ